TTERRIFSGGANCSLRVACSIGANFLSFGYGDSATPLTGGARFGHWDGFSICFHVILFRAMLKGPFPICDLGRIDAEFVGVLFTRDPLVDESLAYASTRNTKTGHPIDGIDSQTEAVSLITNGKL